MNLTKKITQIFSLIFLAFLIASCDPGCVEEDEFDTESVIIESKPTTDGIYGTYDPVDGGQRAEWHDTGLKSNGERFLIQISGAWTPWNGNNTDDTKLKNLASCFPNKLCAKRSPATPNCICYTGQTPAVEKGPDGNPVSTNCSILANQNDPAKCTCTTDPQYGTALDYGVYHIPINYYDKSEAARIADRQSECKLDRGMGAYIALFGSRGIDIPVRVYHLFSTEETCNVVRDSNGHCLDSNGNDVTRYVFRSANSRIFMKDDNNGNNGTDSNTSDDVYHNPNEVVKTIMYDRYYSDNYGRYNMIILRGVGNANDAGLIEFLVRLVEDTVLGKIDSNGDRQGGIIEFMYKSIVQDSTFIIVVQIALSLYIMFYGLAHLFGVAEINKKELMGRVLKIGLIVFFTSKESWYFYNKIVVAFFKDSMDYVVSVIMSLSDSNIDQTSMIKISQMDRQTDISNATRFSYVDLTIKKLLSIGTAKKIFGLFFGAVFFGMLYIPIIYALIGYFIYVMLFVASMYLVNVLKIVFVLSLGPIFMCFTLFKNTEGMFKKWLAFLGARSLEIILLFAILYNFLVLIDKNFTDLLTYRACVTDWGVGPLKLKILKSEINRPLITWLVSFITIAGLIFIMQLVVKKVPELAGKLISIGGQSSSAGGAGMAGAMAGSILGLAKQAASKGFSVAKDAGALALRGGTAAARASGAAGAWNAAGQALGFRGLRTRMRDSIIDSAISAAAKQAGGRTGADRDAFIRKTANETLMNQMRSDPRRMALAGVNMDSIGRRMDNQLVVKPLKDFLKSEAKKLKESGKPLLGSEMTKALEEAAKKWASNNIVGGTSSLASVLGNKSIQQFIKTQGTYSSSEAANSFARNEGAKNKYLQYLKEQEFERHKKAEDSWKGAFGAFTGSYDWLKRAAGNITRSTETNPIMAQENFMRKVDKQEEKRTWAGFFNPLNRINVLDKAMNYGKIRGATDAANKKFMTEQLAIAGKDDDSRKRAFFQQKLSEMAVAGLQKDLKEIRNLEKNGRAGEAAKRKNDLISRVAGETGSSLFDKFSRLSYLHDQLGLGGVDPKLALSRAVRAEFEKKANELSSGTLAGSKERAEELKAMSAGLYGDGKGYEGAVKAVMDQFNVGKREVGDHTQALNDDQNAMKDAALRALGDQIDKAPKDIEDRLAAGTITLAEAKKETEEYKSLINTKVEIEFGSSITDALVKGADVGLKAGNPLLGDHTDGKKQIDYGALQAISLERNANAGKMKMANMDKKIIEFELSKLREEAKKDPSKLAAVAKLEKELADSEAEITKYERQLQDINAREEAIKAGG